MSILMNPLASNRDPELTFSEVFPGTDPDVEHVIAGPGAFCIYPVLEKKNRLRSCYVVLRNCICELHKSIKDVEMCRPASHCIDLRLVFNVCIIKEVLAIKDECVSVMTPNETYYIELDPKHFDREDFCEVFLERARDARSNFLVRPVYRDEYFEAAWDIQVIVRPRIKRREILNTEENPDILDANPEIGGHRRLCVRSTSLVLFKTEISAHTDIDNPYTRNEFFDFPISVIANYGKHGRYFFMQIGRCSEYGGGELWLESETSESAKSMHERIDLICQREADKRREAGIILTYPGLSQQALKSRMHRERSQNHQAAERKAYDEARKKADGTWEKEQEAIRLRREAEQKKKEEEMAERLRLEKLNKGFMGVVRRTVNAVKNDPNDKGKRGLFGFGKDKKKKSEPEKLVHVFPDTPSYPQYNAQEDYMAYDHQVDPKKTALQYTPFKQIEIPIIPDRSHYKPVPKDYCEMENLAERNMTRTEYVYPLIETEAFINDGTGKPIKLEEKQARSLTGEFEGMSMGEKNEARSFSLGSRPRLLGRDTPLTIPLSAQSCQLKPKPESKTGSLNTVESIVEEKEEQLKEEEASQLDDKPSTSAASAPQTEQPSTSSEIPSTSKIQPEPQPSTSTASAPQTDQPSTSAEIPSTSKVQPEPQPSTSTDLNLQDTQSRQPGEDEAADAVTDLVDARTRAHSLGSRSWIKSATLRKLTNKLHRKKEEPPPMPVVPEPPKDGRSRTGSTSSQPKKIYDPLPEGYRYVNEYGEEEGGDLVEIDFNDKNFAESPLNLCINPPLGPKPPKEGKSVFEKALEERLELQRQMAIDKERRRLEKEEQIRLGILPEKPVIPVRDPNKPKKEKKKKKKQEDNEYVQINPSSPATAKRQAEKIKRQKEEFAKNPNPPENCVVPNRRHRDQCKKLLKRVPSLDSFSSFSSISSDDPVILMHDSNGSLERLESGNGMIVITEHAIADSLMAQSLMRPLSKSMSANTRYLTPHRPSKMREIERQKREKEAALRAQQVAMQRKREEEAARKQPPLSQRHYSVGQQSMRLLRSPSPKHIQNRTDPCSVPNCSLCQEGSGRPRTSFIDSAALLASPASSRKHSTVVTPPLRPRIDSQTQPQPKKSTAPRKKSSLLVSPNLNELMLPQQMGYKLLRNKPSGSRKVSVLDSSPIDADLNECDKEKKQRSASGKKHSSHCRHHRSSLKHHHHSHKHSSSSKCSRARSIPAPQVESTVDYVEIVQPPERGRRRRRRRRHASSSDSSLDLFG